jgi:hypothetical protein
VIDPTRPPAMMHRAAMAPSFLRSSSILIALRNRERTLGRETRFKVD